MKLWKRALGKNKDKKLSVGVLKCPKKISLIVLSC